MVKKEKKNIKLKIIFFFFLGDIKPENIILSKIGDFSHLQPKLIDVGVSTFDYKKVLGFSKLYNTEKESYSNKSSRVQGELF